MVTQRVTISKIVTDFQVKPSDRGEITILNDPGNQTNDPLLQGSKKTAKPSGVEKPLRRLEGNKRCIMHVCETKRALEFLQSSFLPPCRESRLVGRPTVFSLLARKLRMPFQPKGPKKTGLTAPHLLRRKAFLHHFTKIYICTSCYFFPHQSPGSKSSIKVKHSFRTWASPFCSRLQIAASRWNLCL